MSVRPMAVNNTDKFDESDPFNNLLHKTFTNTEIKNGITKQKVKLKIERLHNSELILHSNPNVQNILS